MPMRRLLRRDRSRGEESSVAVDADGALVRGREARERAQHRRLAAARGAEEGDELFLGDVEIDVLQRLEAAEAPCRGRLISMNAMGSS